MDSPVTDDSPAAASLLIVEDHALLAQSLRLGLREEGLEARISSLASPEAVLEEATDVDIVLLDLDLGNLGSGRDLVAPLTERDVEVVILTGTRNRADIAEAIERGAAGYVTKSESFDDLLSSISELAELGRLLSRHQRDQLLGELQASRAAERERRAAFEALTETEQQVLAGLMEGKSAHDIAADRFVSLATVRTQIRSLLRKLDVGSQLALVALARRAGWEPPADDRS